MSAIGWDGAREANRLNWEDSVGVPEHLDAYGVGDYEDPTFVRPLVADDVRVIESHLRSGSIRGLKVCHLQCHMGTDSVSLARLGAHVVGVDFSASALAVARRLAGLHADSARFVEADVLEVTSVLHETFDVVYTSIGTILWLGDLDRWAREIAALLDEGGVFFIRDGHPMLLALDESSTELRIAKRYFGHGRPDRRHDGADRAGDAVVSHPETYHYPHAISEILNALIRAGLSIERFDEGTSLTWRYSPAMAWSDGAQGFVWSDPEDRDRVPLTYTIVARRGPRGPGRPRSRGLT